MTATATQYQQQRERALRRVLKLSAAGRDIGAIPPVADPRRKARAAESLFTFLDTYFPEAFHLPWSDDQRRAIARLETIALAGGLYAFAMPRASGKTAIATRAALWAVLHGHRRFVGLIGANKKKACDLLNAVKRELMTNPLLGADYPEVCYPIRRLEGIAHRCKGQLHHGRQTHVEWASDMIVIPEIPGSAASTAVIAADGLTGAVRGMKYDRPDGTIARPDLVIPDDPQTDQSARSPRQCEHRLEIINGALLGMAGPGKRIAVFMPCTVIREGDVAHTILDRDKSPEWHGERTKMVYTFPTDTRAWDQYAQLRAEELRNGGDGSLSTRFYAERQAAMDAGAKIAWPARFDAGELSAIQHAMNLKLRNEAAFFAEYQNEPLLRDQLQSSLDQEAVFRKITATRRGVVPPTAQHLTMYVDISHKVLWYLVAAWSDGFDGTVVDYDAWPDQRRHHFTLRDAKRTIAMEFPGAGFEGALYGALKTLVTAKLGSEWPRQGGGVARIERCLIDANDPATSDVVYQFVRESPHATVILPSHGRGISAAQMPIVEWKRRPGETIGQHWKIAAAQQHRGIRYIVLDTNYWKSFTAARILTATGDPGSITLFDGTPTAHRMLAEQLCAEYPVHTAGRGRELDEWKQRPDQPDNHLWDCLVGNAVAASTLGVASIGHQRPPPRRRRRRSVTYL